LPKDEDIEKAFSGRRWAARKIRPREVLCFL